jgi:hypothetical protein
MKQNHYKVERIELLEIHELCWSDYIVFLFLKLEFMWSIPRRKDVVLFCELLQIEIEIGVTQLQYFDSFGMTSLLLCVCCFSLYCVQLFSNSYFGGGVGCWLHSKRALSLLLTHTSLYNCTTSGIVFAQ